MKPVQVKGKTLIISIGRGIPTDILRGPPGSPGPSGTGIRGMHERMRQLGGELEIVSTQFGAAVAAVLPPLRVTPGAGSRWRGERKGERLPPLPRRTHVREI